ncbi:PPE domain-containing protein [Goodfellowiella coeruleoviolacea]|uniref:PPE family protein n=1 Tax=Goodfellowiella coeruleoviolacea TaxID=334858 RepID=A0AAE3GHB9_9PSEU|nr:PPE domain-containing protein [Goodfellowiella coeruleoviolacea]MCP2166138.1 PPE family protein [Goodfellowiella coeruleoviolacea]
MSDLRWQGHTHEQLYNWIHAGQGPQALVPLQDGWGKMAETLAQIDSELQSGLEKLNASWEGDAADSAQAALSPLTQWAQDAQTGSDVMKSSAELQADYISTARKEMPEPVQVTTEAPSTMDMVLGAMGGGLGIAHVVAQQADHEAQESAQNEAQQKAIAVMNTYSSNSEWNSSTLGEFVEPPKVVIDTPAPVRNDNSSVVGPDSSSSNYSSNSVGTHSSYAHSAPSVSGSGVPSALSGGGGGVSGVPTPQGGSVVTPPNTHLSGATTLPNLTNPNLNNNKITLPNNPVNNPNLPLTGGGSFYGNTNNPLNRPGTLPGLGGGRGGAGGPGGFGAGKTGVNPFASAKGSLLGGPGSGGLGSGGLGTGGLSAEEIAARKGGAGNAGLGRAGAAAGIGAFGDEPHANRGVAAAGAAGRGGAAGAGAGAAGGRGNANGEEDLEHKAADYLVETEDVFGDERLVAPPVIGETN